jgi:hypothetical protein
VRRTANGNSLSPFPAFLTICAIGAAAVLQAPAANAQDDLTTSAAAPKPAATTTTAAAAPATDAPAKPAAKPARKPAGQYYVDFRARTAQSYGHAFVWFGRSDQRAVEVAGLHPATDSNVPYVIGHVLPVPAETGASYGDLDPQYLTANYRVYMNEAEAQRVFGYIKQLQRTSVVWNAATFNCVWFISQIAQHMGLRVPGSHLLYPEDWVNELRALNGASRPARPAAAASQAPQTRAVTAERYVEARPDYQ